jgi:hypothetical protein
MQIDAWLGITSSILAVSGIGSAAAVVRGFRNWAKAERARGREEQKKADELAAYKKETTESIARATESLAAKIDAVKADVADVKKDIRNGGLKEAIGAMQNACGVRMATVEKGLVDHERLPGHALVAQDIAALKADVEMLKKK